MTRKFRCTNIDWDVDEEDEADELPTHQDVKLEDIPEDISDDELEELVSDKLTDLIGYCHNGFKYVEI